MPFPQEQTRGVKGWTRRIDHRKLSSPWVVRMIGVQGPDFPGAWFQEPEVPIGSAQSSPSLGVNSIPEDRGGAQGRGHQDRWSGTGWAMPWLSVPQPHLPGA